MKTIRLSLLCASVAFFFIGDAIYTSAYAEDFWCNDKIISVGMSAGEVRSACGKPTEIKLRPSVRHRLYTGAGWDEVVESGGEWWIYNFGSSRLMQKLLLIDGVVTENQTLGFGYDR